MIRTTTNVIKHTQIHTDKTDHAGYFTLKVSQNIEEAMLYHFAEMSSCMFSILCRYVCNFKGILHLGKDECIFKMGHKYVEEM